LKIYKIDKPATPVIIVHVNFTYNKWVKTSTIKRPRLDLGCCVTQGETEREREDKEVIIK
jgi:hypothetical protein